MSVLFEYAVPPQRTPRAVVEQSIAVISRAAGQLRRSTALMRDISARGVFFYADFSPELGSSIQLVLTFPTEITYTAPILALCHGTVRRIERNAFVGKFGVAVEIRSYEPILGTQHRAP